MANCGVGRGKWMLLRLQSQWWRESAAEQGKHWLHDDLNKGNTNRSKTTDLHGSGWNILEWSWKYFCAPISIKLDFSRAPFCSCATLLVSKCSVKFYPGHFFLSRVQRLLEVVAPSVLEGALVVMIVVRVPEDAGSGSGNLTTKYHISHSCGTDFLHPW